MLTARELALAGCRVCVVDRQAPGQESSWAGGGIISPLFPWRYLDSVTALASWGQAHYETLCDDLGSSSGIDPEYTRSGLVLVAPGEEEAALAWAARHGHEMEHIDEAAFRQIEPAAATPAEAALWMPRVAQLRNPRLVKALRRVLEADPRVELLSDNAVRGITVENGRCTGVLTERGPVAAGAVVTSAGAWSRGLLESLPHTPDLRPVRGQMLLFDTPPGTIQRMVLEASRYVIPRRDGHVLFGSTIEEAGFAKETTAEAREELHTIATERFPVLRNCPVVKHWAGLRPGSPAGVPYIGPHPDIACLFVNAGHFRNGIVLGAASARLAADLVLGHPPILDPSPYGWTAPRG